ncbi:MAG TPA: ATP-binding protein [Sphingomicrobium sp.]|nr:ATP-binding protein [Sphingomicrobium sp.]
MRSSGTWPLMLAAVGYTVAFTLFHQLALLSGQPASLWGTSISYSLLFPAAGLRFAALWHFGPRSVLVIAPLEALGLAALGVYGLGTTADLLVLCSIVGPPLGYALAIALAGRPIVARSLPLGPEASKFGIAALLAPVLGFAASAPWQFALGGGFAEGLPGLLGQFFVFALSDFLGILLIAPAALWLVSVLKAKSVPDLCPLRSWLEAAAVLAIGTLVVIGLEVAGFGVRLVPMMLAVGLVGLRFGRLLAWASTLAVSAGGLWASAAYPAQLNGLSIHLQLAGIALVAFLAGSYADDRKRHDRELRLRDRALLQSERLKTLRAMSVAVIHELSQPLSTLSLETSYLARLSASPDASPEEIRETSTLIARKTESLATLVRRLRSFGSPTGERKTIAISKLVREVVEVISAEAKAAAVRLEMRIRSDLAIDGLDVELQQALTNLLRNAIAASPGGIVELIAHKRPDELIEIAVINTPDPESPYRQGMGVGKLIVEAIAELHGGSLIEEAGETGERRMTLVLPAAHLAQA